MTPDPEPAPTPSRVSVALGARAYDILVGPGLIGRAGGLIRPLLPRPYTVIVTDENVARHHLAAFEKALAGAGIACRHVILSPGEGIKSFNGLQDLCEKLLELRVERRDLVVALGGGVIGDITGFAASILRRGMGFIQVPTTLLAQVDSSVGGKTGINTRHGKNLVGSFHQPRLVLADMGVLDSLPRRELLAGYAEVVKYGLLGDAAFFEWLERHGAAVLDGDLAARQYAVETSCRAKAAIVARDEREDGERALLNLGHTFGHALEAAHGFSDRLLHGEAVAIGMCLALRLSVRLGLASGQDAGRAESHLAAVGLPTRPFGARPEQILELMRQDKKVVDGRMSFILARGIGQAFQTREVAENAVLEVLREACEEGAEAAARAAG
ncbi:MAG: 3-dehydroquinate synthase [Alphaproteobacteria bacterium]|nr:3-dehydroquinate synthase [Alphaproteobacteria bacterium]